MNKFLKTAGFVALFTGFSALGAFGQAKKPTTDSTKFKPVVTQKNILGVQFDKTKIDVKPGKAQDSVTIKLPNKKKADAIKQGEKDYKDKTDEEKRIADYNWEHGGRDAWKKRNPDSLDHKVAGPVTAGSSSESKERLNIFLLQQFILAKRDSIPLKIDSVLNKAGPIFTVGYIRHQDIDPKLSAYNMGDDGKQNTTLNGFFARVEIPLWEKEIGTYTKTTVTTTFPDSKNQSLAEYLKKFVAQEKSAIVKELDANEQFQEFLKTRLASDKETTVGNNSEEFASYLSSLPKDTTFNGPVKPKKEKTPFQKIAKARVLAEVQIYEQKEAEGILRNPYKNPEDEYFNYKNGNIAAMYNNVRIGFLGGLEGRKGRAVGGINADAGMIIYPTKSKITIDGYPQIQDQINKDAKDVFGAYGRLTVAGEFMLSKQSKVQKRKGLSVYADVDAQITSQNSSVHVLPMNALDGTAPYKITGDNKSWHVKAGLRYRF